MRKLKLSEMKVKSFVTSSDKIRGGTNITQQCETQQCNTYDYCPTLLVQGDLGICEAPTRQCTEFCDIPLTQFLCR